MTEPKIDTKFYRTEKDEEQGSFYSRLLTRFGDYQGREIVCFNCGQPETEKDHWTKEYHVLDTTVYVNKKPSAKAATITGRPEAIEEAKSFLERITEMELHEVDVLAGEQ